jgi:phosphatidylethanolamine/phosphatidyl-N-methylethanolamine N-methyltransferase
MNRDLFEFIKAAIDHPLEVSTLFPTSPVLAKRILSYIPFALQTQIVELGPGTGAITRFLAPQLKNNAHYLGIEINQEMVTYLRGRFTHLRFQQGAADTISTLLPPQSVSSVVSSLPWTMFSSEIQEKTLSAISSSLKPGGLFLTYVCINATWYPQAKNLNRLLLERFSVIKKSPIIWRNMPPAFIYVCTK